MRGLRLWVIALAACLYCGDAWAYEQVATTSGPLTVGPYLAGERVVWADYRCLDGCGGVFGDRVSEDRYRVAALGSRPLLIDREPRYYVEGGYNDNGPTVTRRYGFAGDWMVRADMLDSIPSGTNVRRIRAGRIGGRLPDLFRCTSEALPPMLGFALDRGRLAYRRSPCADGAAPLAVRDLRTGRERLVAQPQGGRLDPTELRGSLLLAYRSTGPPGVEGGFRVIRWQTDTTVADFNPGRTDVIVMQSDGTVATLTNPYPHPDNDESCHGTVALWRPPAYRRQVVAHGACEPLRLNGGVVTFAAVRPRDAYLPPQEIRQVTASGRVRTVVRLGRGEGSDAFDADGRYVAFGVQRCDRSFSILRLRQGERSYRGGSLLCPVRFPSRIVRAEGRRALVRLSCPRACRGTVLLGRGRLRLATGSLRIRGTRSVSIRLTAAAVGLLRGHRRVEAELRAAVSDRNGRPRTYRARVVLVR